MDNRRDDAGSKATTNSGGSDAMRGNFLTPPRWSKGNARRLIARQFLVLTGGAAASAIASWIIVGSFPPTLSDQSRSSIDITRASERANADCLQELRETRLELERLSSARWSRERPLSVLVALSEGLPGGAWISEITGHEDTIVISGYAESDRDIRDAVSAFEARGSLKDPRLLSSAEVSTSQGHRGMEFSFSAAFPRPRGG